MYICTYIMGFLQDFSPLGSGAKLPSFRVPVISHVADGGQAAKWNQRAEASRTAGKVRAWKQQKWRIWACKRGDLTKHVIQNHPKMGISYDLLNMGI